MVKEEGRKRILLTDELRRVLAVKDKDLGRKAFLKSHWESIASVDFATVEVWTTNGLTTFYILVVIRLSSRRMEIAGITENPNGEWVRQIARNLTGYDGFLSSARYLLLDRDTKFLPFRNYLTELTDTNVVLLPPKSPNLNAHIERYMRSMKSECLDRMIFFGRQSLERALREFVTHYHGERNHQGLENRIIDPGVEVGLKEGDIRCRERLGGLLRYFHPAHREPAESDFFGIHVWLLFEKSNRSPGGDGEKEPVGIPRAWDRVDRVFIRLQVSLSALS